MGCVRDRLIVVSTAQLAPEARAWLCARSELHEKANDGHDFASYRHGLRQCGPDADQVILTNDSVVFPYDPQRIFETMSSRGADFWGLTPGYGFSHHIQSYFLVFERAALDSRAFHEFWSGVEDLTARQDVIVRGEVALSAALAGAGLKLDTVYRPGPVELIRGAVRAHAMELEAAVSERRWRAVARVAASTSLPGTTP